MSNLELPRSLDGPDRTPIVHAAHRAAHAASWATFTREAVAAEAGVSLGTVSNAFGGMAALRSEVMRHAVAIGDPVIIAQGLAARDPIAQAAPEGLKYKALATLS